LQFILIIFILEFNYEKIAYELIENHLKNYIIRGEDMVKDSNFNGSPIQKLEELIKDPAKCFSGDQTYQYINNNKNLVEDICFEKTFIALVAPSLCGKTQSAFAMREMRPLYFVLNEFSVREGKKAQPIYANFDSLNKMIENVGVADLRFMKENEKYKNIFESVEIDANYLEADEKSNYAKVELTDEESIATASAETELNSPKTKMERVYTNVKYIYSCVSASNLINEFKHQKFFTLGFLVALMEEAEAKYDENSESELIPGTKKSWMEFHAKRDGERSEFYFSALSIAEALKKKHLF